MHRISSDLCYQSEGRHSTAASPVGHYRVTTEYYAYAPCRVKMSVGRDFITDTILLLSADFGRKGNWGDTLSGKTR